MAAGFANITIFDHAKRSKSFNQRLTAVNDVTDWVLCQKDIAVQLTGPSTVVTAVVERSTINPALGANPAPLDSTNLTGNPTTGINVNQFYEPGAAWWRVRVTALTGTAVDVALTTSGE